MSVAWRQHLPPLIRAVARSYDAGARIELAWSVDRAAQVLFAIQRIPCAIVGGDILRATGRALAPNFENWHCEIEREEPWPDYVRRSSEEATRYLAGLYPVRSLWFTPICTLAPTAAQRLKVLVHRSP